MKHLPMTEQAVRYIMEATWAEAMAVVARTARQAAADLPEKIDGKAALTVFAATVEALNRKGPTKEGSNAPS